MPSGETLTPHRRGRAAATGPFPTDPALMRRGFFYCWAIVAIAFFADSIDGYLFLKDPVLHIIYEAASFWADKVHWKPDEDYPYDRV